MIFLWFLVVSCFGNAYDFVFVFVAVCFFLLYGTCILCLLNRVTVASSAMSAILNLSERRVDAVKSGSLRCADEYHIFRQLIFMFGAGITLTI